jgi:hypothetical protein
MLWALAATPALAKEPVDLVEGFDDELTALAGAETDHEFRWQVVPEAVSESDPVDDLFTLAGVAPSFVPAYADLIQASQFGFTLSSEAFQSLFGPDGVLDCARPEVSCPTYKTSARPFAKGVIVVGYQLAAAPGLSGTETFTVAVLAYDDAFPTFEDPRPESPFAGINKAWRVDITAEGDAVRYLQVVTGPFEEFHTDARVLMAGDHGWFLIPTGEFDLASSILGEDVHTNAAPSPDAPPEEQGADAIRSASELLMRPVGPLGELERIIRELETPAEESPTEEPAAEEDEGNSFWWILLGIGIFSVLAGGLLFTGYTRTRETMPKEDIGPPGPGHTMVREKKPPVEHLEVETPRTVVRRTPPVEHAVCDWAVYYRTAAGPQVLRPAAGHECCTYTIKVEMTVVTRELAARGRQEGVTPGAPRARLRIPSLTLEPVGLGGRVEAAVRSGPAEDLGWMQGLGEPTRPEDVGEYRQIRSHEEPPDVAAHVAWDVVHDVSVNLESMCPGHVNTFSAVASSQISMHAGIECTNGGPPECPIEFSADGWARGAVGIFLDYDLKHQIGSDPDEIEPVAPPGTPFHAITDLHDHEQRDRLDYTASEVASDEGTSESDAFFLKFLTGLVGDAGTIVPQAVWASTGRVTALVGPTVEHGATIDAAMRRVDCVGAPCCGFMECRCEPALQIRFGGRMGVIEVDGKSYRITPPPGAVGATQPWPLG